MTATASLLVNHDLMDQLSANLSMMFSTATEHDNGEYVTGYTIKTGAIHRVLGLMSAAGYHVMLPVNVIQAFKPGPQEQKYLCEKGEIGDCWRACIATILARSVESVPHFALLGVQHFIPTTLAWLEAEGFEASIDADDFKDKGLRPMRQCILRGISSRGRAHAVVGDTETGKMIHDPHPSKEGLLEVVSRFYLFPRHRGPAAAT